jgi:hypothetical protein
MTIRRYSECLQTSFTLMAASRASAELIGCEGKDNIGRGERELTAVSPKVHEETSALFFHGPCRGVTSV